MRVILLAALLAAAEASDAADWRYFAAGGFSAALSHGYTTPIDVVKTRMQTNPELGTSVTEAARTIVKEEGLPFLLNGLAPTCAGYGVEGALKFGCYELMKPVFSKLTNSRMFNYLAASVVAGAVASVVLCPAEEVRIKQVSDPGYCDGGAIATLRKLSKENGALASFQGMPAMCAKQVPYTMGKQVSTAQPNETCTR
jgi:solute carrier family 25 phosphate transporter 3